MQWCNAFDPDQGLHPMAFLCLQRIVFLSFPIMSIVDLSKNIYIYIYIFDLPYLCTWPKKQKPFGQCHSKRAPRHLSRPAAYIRPCNLHGHLCIGVFRVDGPWGGHVSWTVEGCKTCATLRSVLGMVCGEQTLSFNNVSLSKEKDTTSFKF